MQEGGTTGFIAKPGAYEWRSDALDPQSIFAGDGIELREVGILGDVKFAAAKAQALGI